MCIYKHASINTCLYTYMRTPFMNIFILTNQMERHQNKKEDSTNKHKHLGFELRSADANAAMLVGYPCATG